VALRDYRKNHIRLHLKQQKTLRDSENPLVLPFRISYIDYHTPIKRQKERSAVIWMDSEGLLPCAAIGLV
jgi:hypothetical protein